MKHLSRHRLGVSLLFVLAVALGKTGIPEISHAASANRAGHRVDPMTAGASVTFPLYDQGVHVAGNMYFAITNDGLVGYWNHEGLSRDFELPIPEDCSYTSGLGFPLGSCHGYMYGGGIWVGGIVAGDTLVSLGMNATSSESDREILSFDSLRESSNIEGRSDYDPLARSHQQLTCVYSDTANVQTQDELEVRYHKPLGIEIHQVSHSWLSEPYDDFIVVEYALRNISSAPIESCFVGLFVDPDVYDSGSESIGEGYFDDISGYLLNEGIAYTMDNDGDPTDSGSWDEASVRGATGMLLLGSEPAAACTTYNWWTFPERLWGPGNPWDNRYLPYPPTGDRISYYVMAHPNVDIDQLWVAVDTSIWPLPRFAYGDLANGIDTRSLLAFGPYDLNPGDSVRFAVAFVTGDSVHQGPLDFQDYWDAFDPQPYTDRLYFGDLIRNADAARLIYNNGFDLVNGAPPWVRLKPVSDTGVSITWAPAPYTAADHFRIFRRIADGFSEWEPIGESALNARLFVDPNGMPGVTYDYAVSGVDGDGVEGYKSKPVSFTHGLPRVSPSLQPIEDGMTTGVRWSASVPATGFAQYEYVNIYRRAATDTAVLYGRVPLFGDWSPVSKEESQQPGTIARAMGRGLLSTGSDPPPVLIPRVTIAGDFIDTHVESGKEYWYTAALISALGHEGPRSAEVRVIPMALDRRGIVISQYLRSRGVALLNFDSAFAFYSALADSHEFSQLTLAPETTANSDNPPPPVDLLDTLSHNQVVVFVWESASIDDGPDAETILRIEEYMERGGRCILVGRNMPSRLFGRYWGWNDVRATWTDKPGFIRDVLGVFGARLEDFWRTSPYSPCTLSVEFRAAAALAPEYPDLIPDTTLVDWGMGSSLITRCAVVGGGIVPIVGVIDSVSSEVDVLYTYEAGYPDTSSLQGLPTAIRRNDDIARYVLFNFPLSQMQRPAAFEALNVALADLEGDAPGARRKADSKHALLEYLFGDKPLTPHPSWDANRDGLIDLRDLIILTSRM